MTRRCGGHFGRLSEPLRRGSRHEGAGTIRSPQLGVKVPGGLFRPRIGGFSARRPLPYRAQPGIIRAKQRATRRSR